MSLQSKDIRLEEILSGSVFRELEIVKMRGTLIERPLHAFTLHRGFHVLPLFKNKPVGNPSRYAIHPEQDERYHTGNPTLDEVTGGYRKGNTVFLELGPNIAPIVPALTVGPLRASFINSQRGVLFLPPSGESVRRITDFDQQYGVTTEEHQSLLRVATTLPEEETSMNLGLDPGDIKMSRRIWREEASRLHRETGQPILKIVYADRLSKTWPEAQSRSFLVTESMHTRNTGGILVLLSRPGEEVTTQHASNLAHIHLRLNNQRGVILMDGVKPQTPLYALEQDNSEGYPSLVLTPIY